MSREQIYIGLGANLGDPVAQIRHALIKTQRRNLLRGPIRRSSLYRTPPWGDVKDQPWFMNAVVGGITVLPPLQLLAGLKEIERDLGRKAGTPRHGPREIDLDILLYGCQILRLPDLVVPHPQLIHRAFALLPLVEIAPDLCEPGSGRAYSCHLDLLGDEVAMVEKTTQTF